MEFVVVGVFLTVTTGSATSSAFATQGAAEIPTLPFSSENRYVDPALRDRSAGVGVLVAMDASVSAADVAQHMRGARVLPDIGGVRLVTGTAGPDGIAALESLPSVFALLENRPTPLQEMRKPNLDRALDTPLGRMRLAEPVAIEDVFARSPLLDGPEIAMRDVVNFTGARQAWTELGVDGTGVTIAVVDTGVDFGAFNLGDGAVARMANGWPSSFDPDGMTFAYTTTSVTNYTLGPSEFVTTAGTDPLIYLLDIYGVLPGGFGPKAVTFSGLFGIPFPSDMEITGLVPSMSGTYRFGILWEWNFGIDLFPILLVDANAPFVYDTIYLDLSFDWWLQGFGPGPDYSFADEAALVPAGGPVVAARDMDADGYVDISAGIPAHVLDIWGFHPRAADVFTVIPPIDPAGDVVGFVYDWQGHGTSVASSAAGRETNHPVAGPGTGPGATVMGVPVLTLGSILEAWLWSAGFDLVATALPSPIDNYGLVFGEWTYTGNHKADIVSNSWGVSDWVTWRYGEPWPWYDILTVVEDVLMTPGYADPAFPGVLMVHAAGNGASGYGTMTNPGYNTLALTVGASTSLNYTGLPTAGYHDDVISWSGRGPTALGMLKPDVLQVGAYGWASAPIWLWPFVGGTGGVDSYTLFGGTSQATPVTSGSAAVTIEAFEVATGSRPDPATVKAILKSSAVDIGYDPFLQGAGRVNVYQAAALAMGNSGILVTTPATWENARRMLTGAYASAFAGYGREVSLAPPEGPIADASWYAGSVRAGSATGATFTVESPGGSLSGTVAAVWHARVSTISLSGTTRTIGAGWLEGYGDVLTLAPGDIPVGADLMVVKSAMPYDFLDPNGNYVWDNRSRVIVADWIDANGDTNVDLSELFTFNYGYNTGTTSEATVGLPDGRFQGTPVVWFSHAPAPGRSFTPMPYEITVEFYDRIAWPWVTVPGTFSASPGSPATLVAQLAVPAGANPGLYQGQILFTPSGGNVTAIPVSVIVPRVIDAATLSGRLTFAGSNQVYDSSIVSGMFDWRWRYEAGDWKLWFVEVEDPNTIVMRVDASWPGAQTDVDIWSIRPSGILDDSTFSPYLGSGRFRWSTRTGGTEDYVVFPTTSGLDGTETGLYTFALHNVLFDGAATSERLTGNVGVVKLNPRGPVTIVTPPGATVSVPFTLSTGFDLNIITFAAQMPTPFPTSATPGLTPALGTGGSLPLWANITVPADTPDGVYTHHVFVASVEFEPIFARIDIVVDATGPGVTIIEPTANAHLRGATTIVAAVSDTSAIASVTFSAGLTSGNMTRDPASGLWKASWDTPGSPDGAQTVRVIATDEVGNTASASVGVIVDNTPPAVTFTSPAAGTWVRGTVSVAFTVTDANLDAARFRYGATTVDVLGQTSVSVNTASLGDGAWTFEIQAYDRAGNEGMSTLTVNVDNTPPVAVLRAPADGAFLRGSITASFLATDANVLNATLTVGSQTPINIVGLTTATIDTTAIPDGAQAFSLAIADRAGNTASASVTATVDNTPPVVAISSPTANQNMRGSHTITWSATDANLDRVWLVVDGESREVTGTTSLSWDTNTVGDGAHSIEVRAVDKAGNEATTTVSVTTDNVKVANDAAFLNGLLIGLIVAVILGLLIGFLLGRRRKKPAEEAAPAPTAPEPVPEGPPPSGEEL